MAEDILGISGQMDISDIQQSFDKLIGDLNQLGVKIDEVSGKMSKALNDIAKSAASDSEKAKQSIEVYKSGIADINKALETTPEALKKLGAEATTAEATLDKLKNKLSEAQEGSQKWNEINEQLKNQQNLVNKLNGEYDTMLGTFGNTQQYVGMLNSAIEALNAGRSVSTAVTGASAIAHTGVTAAVGAEALAHGDNSAKIADETEKIEQNTEASIRAREAAKENLSETQKTINALDAAADSLKNGKDAEEEYIEARKKAIAQIDEYNAKISEEKDKQKQLNEEYDKVPETPRKLESSDGSFSTVMMKDSEATRQYNEALAESISKVKEYQAKINEITSVLESYGKVEDSNNNKKEEGISSDNKQLEAIKAKEEEIQKLKEYLAGLDEFREKLKSGTESASFLDTLYTYGFSGHGGEYGKTIEQIEKAESELDRLKQTAALAANETANVGKELSKEQLAESITKNNEQLAILNERLKSAKDRYGSNSDEVNKLKEQHKAISEEIDKAHEGLQKMGTSYKEVVKDAKEAAKESKNIGDKTDDAAKKVGGIFSKFKGTIGGALKGDFSGIFSFFGKIGVWGAALGAIGKGLYELTIRAEEFRDALQPLSHYIDDNRLADVRQDILALSSTTTKSVADMAQAATQFVKVWEGLRDSSDALIIMVKSANEFGALAGKTSQESAKYLSNLASEYHMTAQEATQASNMIATAAHNSTSTFGEMADAISSAGTNASMYGVSFKDMATLIGYSSNQFGGAQKAASKFSMLLMSMEKMQNEKYKPSVVGMVQALQNLKDAMDKGELSEKSFQGRIRQTARYFINNADAIAEYGKHIDSTKAKEELLADANARASVNVNKLKNAWEGFLTSINANLTPVLTNVLQFFNKIIGGAQRTADELNYLKNFDKIHKDSKQGQKYAGSVTSNWTGDPLDNAVINMGAKSQYNVSKDQGLELYRKQRDRLKRIYQQGLKKAQDKWKHASGNAYANAAGNFLLRYYNKNRASFSEFTPQMFNDFLRNQRGSTVALTQKTINTSNGGGSNFTPTPDKNKEKLAEQQRQYREQQAEQQAKQLADDKKIEWELYLAEQEKGIAEMHEGNEKELAQRKLDFEKKKHQIEEEAESLRQKNISVAKAAYDKNPANKKKEGFYASGLDKDVTLTDEQQNLINAKMDLLNAQQEEDAKKRLASELQSLYDYLKEYGTVQEQRYAIAKEYDDKILKATDENQKKILKKQKEAALAQTDAKKLAMGIDWGASFNGVGTVLKDLAKDVLSKVEDYMKTADFKNLSANDKKSYVDLRNNLRQETDTGFSPFNLSKWNEVAQDVKAYQDSVRKVEQISAIHSQAVENYEKAQDELKNATTKKAKDIAEIKVVTAKKIAEGTGKQQTEAEGEMKDAQGKLVTSTEDASNGLQKFQQMLGNITSGSLSNFVKGVGQLVNSIAGKSTKVGDALQGLGGKIGGLVGAILSIIDALGEDPANFIDELLNKITKVIEAVLSQLPQIILSVLKGVGNIVGGVIKGLGNLFSGGALFGSNVSKMEAEIAELSASNKELASAIDDLKSAIESDDNTNQQSVEAYKNAVDAQKEWNENQRKAISNRASEWSNSGHGFLGLAGRQSFNSHANDDKGSWLQAFNNTLSKFGYSSKIGSASDVWNLSSEEMKTLRDFSPKAWAAFFKAGSGGQSNPQDLVNEYIDKAGVEEELTDALNKKLTGYDWSGFKGSYSSLLKDLKSETTDFADFVTETINNAAIDAFMNNETTKNRIKQIQDMIADAAKDGNIDKDEAEAIRSKNEQLADYLISERKKLIDAGIIQETTSQSEQTATGKGIQAITEDQASSLIGIGYAMQIALEQGNEVRKGISLDVSFLRSYSETIGNNISEMRDIQYQGLEQLQAINKNTAPIILIREDIASMYKLMKDRY